MSSTVSSGVLLEVSSIKLEQETCTEGAVDDGTRTDHAAGTNTPPLSRPCTDTGRSNQGRSTDTTSSATTTTSAATIPSRSSSSNSLPSAAAAVAATHSSSSSNSVGAAVSSVEEAGARVPLSHPFSPVVTAAAKTSYLSAAASNNNSSSSHGGGSFSPHRGMNGTSATPSPPALSSPPTMAPHDPAAALPASARDTQRQVAKVRRFLTTLQQFASEINADAGEKVRGLTLNLMSGLISVEEFHLALQEVTHFPLRPFVLPFLRSHIPLLTRELRRHATRHGMPVQQFVAVQEAALHEAAAAVAPGSEPGTDFFSHDPSSSTSIGSQSSSGGGGGGGAMNGAVSGFVAAGTKRKLHSSSYFDPGDRHNNITGTTDSISPPPAKRLFSPPFPVLGGSSPDPPSMVAAAQGGTNPPTAAHVVNDDEWKNIHMMLNCILSMVEKTRRALTILQQRDDLTSTPPSAAQARAPAPAAEVRVSRNSEYDAEVRRHASELVAQAIRATEDRVAEVKRKAEEAVSEVRRAAVTEVQRAVTAADARAQELVAAERARMEALLREIGRRETSAVVPDHRAPDPHQACWNCGRKAHETCSGCNVARYCGPFCQHKDWDAHHKVCSPTLAAANNPTTTPTTTNNNNNNPITSNNNTSSCNSSVISSTLSQNGHAVAPKLAPVTHKLLAKASDVTKMEQN